MMAYATVLVPNAFVLILPLVAVARHVYTPPYALLNPRGSK